MVVLRPDGTQDVLRGDQGTGWTGGLVVDPSSPRRLLVETRTGWIATGDGGQTWRRLRLPVPVTHAVPAFDPSRPGTIDLLPGGTALWQTADGGAHWRRLSRPPLGGATRVVVGAGGLVAASGEGGIALSSNGGRTFRRSGLERRVGACIRELSFTPAGEWLAATQQGVFRRTRTGPWLSLERQLIPLGSEHVASVGPHGSGVVAARHVPWKCQPAALDPQRHDAHVAHAARAGAGRDAR